MNQIELGKFIYKLRIEANLTQDELAEKVGVGSGKTVSKWENGYSMPDIITLKKLSIALNVTLYELTECKRLKKKKYIEATKDYIKSTFDIFKLNIIGKVTIVITILLGIFFGLSVIFAITNYGTVEIYSLKSLDEKYIIKGNIILTNQYNVFNLTDIDYVEIENGFLNIDVFNIDYSVFNNNGYKLIIYSNHKLLNDKSQKINLLQNIRDTSFSIAFDNNKKKEIKFQNNDIFTFQITYNDKAMNIYKIEFPFKINRRYKNIFF